MKNKNAARVMPKFGLTVEKRPGAAIKGGSTRIHLLADSELTQVKKSAAPVTARIPPEEAPSSTDSQSSDCRLLPLVDSALIQVNQHITLTAREFRVGGWSCIRSRRRKPRYKIKYHWHYNQCTDKNIPEYRFRFFKIASHKGYSQWDADAISDNVSYAVQLPIVVAKPIDIAPRQNPVQEVQGNKAQNNADCNDHESIIRVCTLNLNYGVTSTAREFRGKRGKQGFRVNQSDRQILTLLTAIRNQQTASNLVGNI